MRCDGKIRKIVRDMMAVSLMRCAIQKISYAGQTRLTYYYVVRYTYTYTYVLVHVVEYEYTYVRS